MGVKQTNFSTSSSPSVHPTSDHVMFREANVIALRVNALGAEQLNYSVRRTFFPDFEIAEVHCDANLTERTPELTDLNRNPTRTSAVERACLDVIDEIVGRTAASAEHWIAARDFIIRNLRDHRLSVHKVAQSVGVGERQISRVFAAQKTTVGRVIQEERMRSACVRLRDPASRTVSIATIAAEIGFLYASHFTRVFRRTYGMSPSDYRSGKNPAA